MALPPTNEPISYILDHSLRVPFVPQHRPQSGHQTSPPPQQTVSRIWISRSVRTLSFYHDLVNPVYNN
jgi:hypothetical protein